MSKKRPTLRVAPVHDYVHYICSKTISFHGIECYKIKETINKLALILPRRLIAVLCKQARNTLFSRPRVIAMSQMDIDYPETRRDDSIVEVLHEQNVSDPYRWLEDPDSSETVAWVDDQNAVTRKYLSSADHLRSSFESTVKNLFNYDRFSAGWKRGPYFYYYHHVALANQAVLMQSKSIDSAPRVFLDPNVMSTDGTVSLATMEWSRNGQYVAYGVHRGGSDWEEIRVMDCNTLDVLSDVIEWAKFTSVAWHHDGQGFYYMRYPTPPSLESEHQKDKRGAETDQSLNQSCYFHVVGTPQSEDRLVYSDPDNPKRIFGVHVTLDGRYLLLTVSEDCSPKNQVWYVNLTTHFGQEADGVVRFIDDSYDAQFNYLANDEHLFYFMTNWKAPKNRIIRLSLDDEVDACDEVIAEHPENVLSSASAVNFDQLALVYMQDAHDRLVIHNLKSGALHFDVSLPDIGSVSVSADREHGFLMYKFTSFLYAGTVYYVDLNHPQGDGTRVFRRMDPPKFDPSKYRTRQHFYLSKDGTTRVPMFVIGPADNAEMDKRPCLLYGYGGFMISLTPFYSARWAAWLECLGGVVAIANIRGGAEYGTKWHDEGILDRKQNVFDDFQYGARFLCDKLAVTDAGSLMIMGGSNGGLLVGACVNQAPELFGAAVAQVGVHDILRFHKFTIGSAWISDFGNPDKPEDFEYQIKYSPLHNVFNPDERGVPYPAILLTTADHDDRVVPLHTLKYGAELQYRAGGSELQRGKPLLLRIDVKAGHGAGKPTSKIIEEICDTLLFSALALNVKV